MTNKTTKKKRRKRIHTPHYFCCWHNTVTTSILFNGCLYPTLPHCIIRQSEAAFIFFPQSRSRRVKTRYQYQIIIIIIMHSIYLYSAYPRYTPCSKRFTLSPGAQHTSNTKGHLGDFYNICRQGQCCSSPGGPPSLTSASDRTGKFVWNTFPKGIPFKVPSSDFRTRGPRHKVNWALKATIESVTSLGSLCEVSYPRTQRLAGKKQQACHLSHHRHPSYYWARSVKLALCKRHARRVNHSAIECQKHRWPKSSRRESHRDLGTVNTKVETQGIGNGNQIIQTRKSSIRIAVSDALPYFVVYW